MSFLSLDIYHGVLSNFIMKIINENSVWTYIAMCFTLYYSTLKNNSTTDLRWEVVKFKKWSS